MAIAEIGDVDDVDKLSELFGAKPEGGFIAFEHDSDPGKRRIVRGRDIEGIDVETATGNHTGDARQNAECVLNEDRNRVSHEI